MKSIILTILFVFTIQGLSAQCYPDRHSTSIYDSWISNEARPNPNTTRGPSHWIMYELNQPTVIGQTHIWNINDPDRLDQGIQNYTVDISVDGVVWNELGEFTLSQASGLTTYEGSAGFDVGGQELKFILITAKDNYGHASNFGFGEIKFEVLDAPLAIEIFDFDVICGMNEEVDIKWSAKSDSNSEFFILEESIDGIEWSSITEVSTQASNDIEEYEYNYGAQEKNKMYRLIAVDANGLSQVLQIATANCADKSSFEVHPNPFSESAILKLTGFDNRNISYSIRDMLGRLVRSENVEVLTESQNVILSNEGLSTGQYILVINDGQNTYRQPIIFVSQD